LVRLASARKHGQKSRAFKYQPLNIALGVAAVPSSTLAELNFFLGGALCRADVYQFVSCDGRGLMSYGVSILMYTSDCVYRQNSQGRETDQLPVVQPPSSSYDQLKLQRRSLAVPQSILIQPMRSLNETAGEGLAFAMHNSALPGRDQNIRARTTSR